LGIGFDVQSQGTFQNLDFEAATLVPISGDPYNRVQFAAAFPGWTGNVGGSLQSGALYNSYFLDSSGIGIIDRNAPTNVLGVRPISGIYTAVMMAGVLLSNPTVPADVTLSQVGLIPDDAQSIRYKVYGISGGGGFVTSVGGQQLTPVVLGSETNYLLVGVDVHQWAGQTAELAFTLVAGRPHRANTYLFLDDIQFSDIAVPEPGAFGLLAFGGVALFWKKLTRQGADTLKFKIENRE
jgi:hypothetical protein